MAFDSSSNLLVTDTSTGFVDKVKSTRPDEVLAGFTDPDGLIFDPYWQPLVARATAAVRRFTHGEPGAASGFVHASHAGGNAIDGVDYSLDNFPENDTDDAVRLGSG